MTNTKPHRSRLWAKEPQSTEVVSVERLTFYALQTIFLLATIGLVYWIIAPAGITAWTKILGALSNAGG
jgi:hypothetical protein